MTFERLRSAAAHVLVDPGALGDRAILLREDDAHHLRRVLRLRSGAAVTATDGAGNWIETEVVFGERGSTELQPTGEQQYDPPIAPVEIATAIPKGDRLDWMVQKVTELGTGRLVLLEADHSVVRWPAERIERHLARVQRIADEALRQSRRTWRLDVAGPTTAIDYLATSAADSAGPLIAEPGGRALTGGDRCVAIGPEGGWSAREVAGAGERVDLGATILRTETAAVAVAARCVAISR
ncbi:MAG: RsmE family RNA methyltransferase [Actinomycetota bacterium]